ncbi:hypothetical protein ACFQ0X_17870 [Streptomyces rectiviolaceus]|uniref:Acyl-CoA carboxylase subunit epsilon n=1 Tax=Streptomyces rectiviolaceus TaxID=332591 RepID=A0ABP6M9N3_9ACTN
MTGAGEPRTGSGEPLAALLATVLAEAMRDERVDAEGQRRAIAAFRSARRARLSSQPTRPHDDWR